MLKLEIFKSVSLNSNALRIFKGGKYIDTCSYDETKYNGDSYHTSGPSAGTTTYWGPSANDTECDAHCG